MKLNFSIWGIRSSKNIPSRRQHSAPVYGVYGRNKLKFDFAIFNDDNSLKCLIECQGEQHYKPVEEFGGTKTFEEQVPNDYAKLEYTKKHGIQFIRISYEEKNIEKIRAILKENGVIGYQGP